MDGSLISVGAVAGHQRADGALRLAVRKDPGSGATGLADLYHAHPMRALFPRPATGDPLTAAMATVSGGLAGGDAVEIDITLGPGADLLLVSQAAEKIYRSIDDEETAVRLRASVGDEASLEILPRETILFDGARQTRRTRLELDGPTSRLLTGDLTIFGRGAMGERFTSGRARDYWRIDRAGAPVWRDATHVTAERLAHPFGLDGATAMGTIVLAAPNPEEARDLARDAVPETEDAKIGVTLLDDLLLIRLLGRDAAEVRARFQALWALLRHHALGRPPRLPPLIHC
jgi:urease accessory protein